MHGPGGFDSRSLPPVRAPGALSVFLSDVVLVGGGHAHVEVLRSAAMRPFKSFRLTLVSRDVCVPYSGMLPGYLAGIYERTEAHVDLRPLCARAGARFVHASATGLDLDSQVVVLGTRPLLRYDLLLLDIGSTPALDSIDGARAHGMPVKPVEQFVARWAEFENNAASIGRRVHVVMIGGGAGGIEVALGLRTRLARAMGDSAGTQVEFTLIDENTDIVPMFRSSVRTRLGRALDNAGVTVVTGSRVVAVKTDRVVLNDGRVLPCDAAVLATGPAPAPWLRETGLKLDARGFVEVDDCLRSVSHPQVLASGDTVAFTDFSVVRNGVHAVRQGPVLAKNLRRIGERQDLLPYRPQKHTMALISTGRRHAIGARGRLTFSGRWVWHLKDYIDRQWLAKYTRFPTMDTGGMEKMRCGGCGAKVPARVLQRALARLEIHRRSEVVLGLGDDAAVTRMDAGMLSVQTIDHFPSFVDDPWIFGRIAAVHALSDVFAMGARPVTALVLAGLLDGSHQMMEEDLVQMLSGVLSVLDAENCSLVGGHTGESERISLGLVVNGTVREEDLVRASGLRPGDLLILTKPLGTGALFAADMRGEAEGEWIEAALESMQRSNGPAADVLLRHGVSAMTDVTGFGFAGHLRGMVDQSRVRVEVQGGSLPAYPGARELLERGIASTLHSGNLSYLSDMMNVREIDPLLFDPQTAGGLLAGVPEENAGTVVEALKACGNAFTAVVGRVRESGQPKIEIRH